MVVSAWPKVLMNLHPTGSHRTRSPSSRRQARDKDVQNNQTAHSDQEVQKARSGKEIQVKAPTDYEITDIMEELMRTLTRPAVRGKEREEEQMEKYKLALGIWTRDIWWPYSFTK